ncbi:MAG: hypothetical protein KTQ49_05960 [Candidatus Omnitrophica bacterium]|nr:hypothetical protein [Candidatus Omnitrophota bacterium]
MENAMVTGMGFSDVPDGQYALWIDNGAGQFTFQVKDNVREGQMVTFSALAESNVPPGAWGGRVKIEFKKINEDGSDTEISEVTSAYANGGTAPWGGGYVNFTAEGIAPEGTERVVFVLESQGGVVGSVIFDKAIAEVSPAKLALSASKRNVAKGDAVGINAHFNNASGNTLTNAELRIKFPHGFDYADKSIRMDGNAVAFREGSLIVSLGTLEPGRRSNVSFVTLVTSGVQIGHEYSMEATVTDGRDLSEKATVQFLVQSDPVFEQGTIIGKVFNDTNENGVQECGELGVPWVRLYTEEGIGIVTDEHGRYHIPGVEPGRHVVKIDGHSLPEGTKFVTEEAYLVRTTPGIMNKANFAVLLPPSGIPENFKKDLMVMVTQAVDVSRPTLDVHMEPNVVKLGVGVLEKEPIFLFDMNYGSFIKKWSLEIRDEAGKPVWTGFGVGQPPAEVLWSGMTEAGLLISPGIYSYQLKVRDSRNREDWTPLKFFEVYSKLDPKAEKNYHPEIPPVGDFNLFKDGKQSIPLVAKPLIRVQGKTQPQNTIKINDTPVSVDQANGMFQKEFFVEAGEHVVNIAAITPSGESTSFNKKITVKDSTFFMVALGEQQLGHNWAEGAMEAADSEAYRDGFRQDGRFSYFLKGKLKGKFLVKSHYDTSDRRSALFTNLNPNDYYPIYGDASTRDYEAHDTAERLYVLVEMDRSYAKWGSFKTGFTDTELATYNRTLSGLKVNFDTVESTVYGDPKRGFKLFTADADHLADHNELYSTGGSLYYTRNRNIIEGSEKIRVEVRDKIQDMAIASYDLQEGQDYEINYEQGRILLSRPLSSVTATDTLTSVDIMDGNPVYLIVDYEYDPGTDQSDIPNRGIRGYTDVGDHFRVGATAVEEKRNGGDYDMRGVDAMIRFGRNTKLTAEYAETAGVQTGDSVSYDGGISYADLSPLRGRHTKQRSSAYMIKAESKPVKNWDVSGYVQEVDPGFSNGYMRSQEGLKKFGVSSRYKFTDSLSARYRYDDSGVVSELMPLDITGSQAAYTEQQSHTAQLAYDDGKYLAEIEYQRRNLHEVESPDTLLPALINQVPFDHGVTGKLGYHINDRLLPYVKVQTTLGGKSDHQFGGGVRYEVIQDLFAYLEQMFGPLGDSTYFGFEKQHAGGARSYANLRSFDRGIGDKVLTTAIGNSFSLSERSRMYSEREYSSYRGVDGFADILGYEGRAGDRWDFGTTFERRHLTGSTTRLLDLAARDALARANTYNTVGGHIGYADGKKFRARTHIEFRRDQDAPKMAQIVTRNSLQYKINEDMSFLSYFNYGDSREMDPGNNPATFLELSNGIAYRPVCNDKLNLLARYTYLRDLGSEEQYNTGYYDNYRFDQAAHIVSADIAYDLNRYFGLVEKVAFKRSIVNTSSNTAVAGNTFLSANRINFHVTRKWDLAVEYRILWQSASLDTLKHGALVEIDREFYEYVRLGIGYNFTDFSDDLRDTNSFRSQGPFVRMTGKF